MPRMPPRLTAAGIHRPVIAISMFVPVEGLSMPRSDSTYSTQEETIAALPAQQVIQ
jgi:hypothetical protein